MRIEGPLWKVTVTEHERGWGQKVDEEVVYTVEKEAEEYADEINNKNKSSSAPDLYYTAIVTKIL